MRIARPGIWAWCAAVAYVPKLPKTTTDLKDIDIHGDAIQDVD